MHGITRKLATLAVGVAIGTGLMGAVPAGAASGQVQAQACSKARDIRVNNNAAGLRYIECHRGSGSKRESSTALWLWDNKHDGKCAIGRVRIGSWQHIWSWCDESHHSPKLISGWHRGADAKVYLSLG